VLLLNLTAQMSIGYRAWDVLGILGPDLPVVRRLYHRVGLFRKEIVPLSLPVEVQIERLRELQPTVIWAYPSALRALIHHLEVPLRELVRPRIVIHSAEVLDPGLRRRLDQDSDAERFNFYSAQEFGLIAWECPAHEGLHLNSDHLVLECLDNGAPASPGTTGRAVLTSLYAKAMPFIRYQLGDLVALSPKKCSCGCPLPLIDHPIGRQDDMVRLPSGRMLAPMRFAYILEEFPLIDQWRVVQVSQDSFVLQLVLRDGFTSEMIDTIRGQFLEYLDEPVSLDIQVTDYIEGETYKFRTFVADY
jgi:phenylacetate-CoA ligase